MTPPQHVTVVEPHADDAFLSLGSTLERWIAGGVEVELVTVFGDSRRNREAARYAAAIGAHHWALGYRESGCGLLGKRPFVPPMLRGDIHRLVSQIAGDQQTIWPLGLRHPEHRWVAGEAGPAAWRYVETPYQLVRRNAAELNELAAGRPAVNIGDKDPAIWRHVPIFASQSMFFYYNSPDRLASAPEIILS